MSNAAVTMTQRLPQPNASPQTARMDREYEPRDRPPLEDRERAPDRRPAPSQEGSGGDISVPASRDQPEQLHIREPDRPSRTVRHHVDLRRIEPQLTQAHDLIAGITEDLRFGRPVTEVTVDGIIASQRKLADALPLIIEIERASRLGRSDAEVGPDPGFGARLEEILDSDLLRAEVPRDREPRGRLVRCLRMVAAALAAALLEFFLQAVLGALGVGDALGQATVASVDAVRDVAHQLQEALPALAAPAVFGSQFIASTVLLNEASELMEAPLASWWSPEASAYQAPFPGAPVPEAPAPESDDDLLDAAVQLTNPSGHPEEQSDIDVSDSDLDQIGPVRPDNEPPQPSGEL